MLKNSRGLDQHFFFCRLPLLWLDYTLSGFFEENFVFGYPFYTPHRYVCSHFRRLFITTPRCLALSTDLNFVVRNDKFPLISFCNSFYLLGDKIPCSKVVLPVIYLYQHLTLRVMIYERFSKKNQNFLISNFRYEQSLVPIIFLPFQSISIYLQG